MKYSLIVPTWNNLECLARMLKPMELSLMDIEVIIVVQEGYDRTCQWLSEMYPPGKTRVRFITNKKNTGWVGGINQGAKIAIGDYLVFCNDDVVFPGKPVFDEMASAMLIAHEELKMPIGICGPLSNYVKGNQFLDQQDLKNLNAVNEALKHNPDFTPAGFISGFCMMVSRDCYNKIGGLDERFNPGGFDDNDYCYRVLEAGFGMVISPKTFVWHEGSITLDREYPDLKQGQKNQHIFVSKWKDKLLKGKNQNCLPISLAMIMKNEEDRVHDCLLNTWPMVKEIKILDAGCTDKSVERAELYGEVIQLETTDLGVARTEIEKHCTQEWILVLDFDERLERYPDWLELRRLIQDKYVDAYTMRIVNIFPGGQQVPQSAVRLYRKGSGKWVGAIHEAFEVSEGKAKDRVESPVIIHEGFLRADKVKNYGDIYAQRIKMELDRNPDNAFLWFQRGLCQFQRGQEIEAEKSWARAIQFGYKGAHQNLGFLYLQKAFKAFHRLAQEMPDGHIQQALGKSLLTEISRLTRMAVEEEENV